MDANVSFPGLWYFCSVIGTPSQSDWPTSVSLPRSSFPRFAAFSLAELIPEMCSSGTCLLKVREQKMYTRNTVVLLDVHTHAKSEGTKIAL